MAKTKKTIVAFLLDETGSMQSIKDDTIGGFNSYLDTLEKENGKNILFTLVKFDSNRFSKVCVNEKLSKVTRLTSDNYKPGAMTPLVDSCMKLILLTEEELSTRNSNYNILCVFQTDGNENDSKEFTNADLSQKIKEKTEAGWVFFFLGAGIDAYSQARKFGIADSHTMSYNRGLTGQTMGVVASASVNYTVTGQSKGFTEEEKKQSGDKFNPKR